jgi:hypothetical protein
MHRRDQRRLGPLPLAHPRQLRAHLALGSIAIRLIPLALFAVACSSTPAGKRRTATGEAERQPRAAVQAPPDAGPPTAPDPDAERAEKARTVADPKGIQGYATVPRDQVSRMEPRATGTVTARTAAAPADDRVRWTIAVTDATGKQHPYTVELPDGIALPAALGASVDVRAGHHGGGPNLIPTLLVTDDKGGLLLAINQLPDGWETDFGRRLSTDRGDTYDEHRHAVKLRAAGEKPVELVSDWRAVTLAGARYYGNASAARRTLKSKKRPPPPDYVGGWIDVALVRVDPPAP